MYKHTIWPVNKACPQLKSGNVFLLRDYPFSYFVHDDDRNGVSSIYCGYKGRDLSNLTFYQYSNLVVFIDSDNNEYTFAIGAIWKNLNAYIKDGGKLDE